MDLQILFHGTWIKGRALQIYAASIHAHVRRHTAFKLAFEALIGSCSLSRLNLSQVVGPTLIQATGHSCTLQAGPRLPESALPLSQQQNWRTGSISSFVSDLVLPPQQESIQEDIQPPARLIEAQDMTRHARPPCYTLLGTWFGHVTREQNCKKRLSPIH